MILVFTAHFTTNVDQLTYTIDLQKSRKENVSEKIDTDHAKAAVWDKGIAFMKEALPSIAKEGFDLYELEKIYLDYLSEYEILIESHITGFGENLIEKAPEYKVIKTDKSVFRKESMHEMFSIFLKVSRSWIQSIITIVQPTGMIFLNTKTPSMVT